MESVKLGRFTPEILKQRKSAYGDHHAV